MDVVTATAQRWSPREYLPTPISDEVLKQVFEAARSSHSCFNEQPWRFLFAKKGSGAPRTALESLLDDGNAFAKQAWVLGIAFAKKTFTHSGAPNRHAGYDTGSAAALMALHAYSLGLGVRFMAGFNASKAQEMLPTGFEPYSMFVIGNVGDGVAPPRQRKPYEELVFENSALLAK